MPPFRRWPILYKLASAILLTLILAEAALRILDYRAGRTSDFFLPKRPLSDSMFEPHPYMGYALKPGFSGRLTVGHINNLGMRGADMPIVKKDKSYRILCLGGSTTFGTHVTSDYNTYPAQLEVALNEGAAAGYRYEVGNCGVPGYNTIENLIQFELRLSDLKPDAVLLYEGANDAPPILSAGFKSDYSHIRQSWRFIEYSPFEQFLLRNCRIYGWASRGTEPEAQATALSQYIFVPGFQGFHVRAETKVNEDGIRAFARNIQNMAAVAKANHCIPVFCTFATCASKQAAGERANLDAIARMNDETRRVAREESAPLIDVAKVFSNKDEFFADWMHMNDLGSLRQAQFIANEGKSIFTFRNRK